MFTVRVVKRWHRLSRELVGVSSLETFRGRMDGALRHPDLVGDVPVYYRRVGPAEV